MKIETKGIFEALPNCMSLQDIIDYLDSRNYDERKVKEEYHLCLLCTKKEYDFQRIT